MPPIVPALPLRHVYRDFCRACGLLPSGDNPGYLSFAGWIPDRSASVVILANDASVEMVDLLRRLLPTAIEP
jgi:hypothetical protein